MAIDVLELQQQIAAGQTGKTIKQLVAQSTELQPTELQTQLLHLSARWSNLEQQIQMDIISLGDANIQRQKITLSLLELLKKLEIPNNTALAIHCSTNKGKENLRFRAGETLQLFYKVTQPCHVRVLYKLADGRTILLHNDLEIPKPQVGKQQLLNEFEVSAPLGKEQVFFYAQASAFAPLDTRATADGYTEVLEENSRGLKPITPKAADQLEIETYS